jgi:hypothetical protein
VAKRPRFSRWRRLPPVFRTGENRPIGTGNEIDRIILYLPARSLDLAEALAEKAGIPAIQDYCGLLLNQAIEAEKDRQKVIEIEARRGPLEGLKEIAADPNYLTEWQLESESRPAPSAPRTIDDITADYVLAEEVEPEAPATADAAGGGEEIAWIEDTEEDSPAVGPAEPWPSTEPGSVSLPSPARPAVRLVVDRAATEILWRHVGFGGDNQDFLPSLRRGVPVPAVRSAELIRALNQLEIEFRGAEVLDRRMAHALHRLALESQVLLTDAWPGVFDARMIAVIRTVQEAVERILSGQDIRY